MLAKSATPAEIIAMETPQQQMENHPVIRTLYDHVEVGYLYMDLVCINEIGISDKSSQKVINDIAFYCKMET